jgi:hypothetical protein
MIDNRPIGILLVLGGAAGVAVAALADELGIGEGHVFGWLQITGVIVGGAVALLGLVLALDWVPFGRAAPGAGGAAGGSAPQTTVVESSRRRERPGASG